MLDPAVVEFIHGGVAVGVATRDDDLRPEFARGWGPEVSADGRSLTLCVSAPEGSRMRANLERNGAVAVGFSPPTIARAVQVKGVARGWVSRRRPIWSGWSGMSGRLSRRPSGSAPRQSFPGACSCARAWLRSSFSIDEVFDQTPGPTAGRRL